jgi:methylenetetrahydrofolate reductase (NADPH)
MRIRDTLDSKVLTLSFEFYPPRDDIGYWDLYRTIESLKPLDPTFVSVTYGAGGTTRKRTIELVQRIKTHIGIESTAHLTCIGSTRQELGRILDELKASRVENLLGLRGDPPPGAPDFPTIEGGFAHADELIAFIRERHSQDFCVGAACYPEVHPECSSAELDLQNLKRKVDAGVDFLITQLFFNNDDFFAFRDRATAAGIGVPIIAGIMPILSVKQIKRFTTMCGAAIPPDLLDKLEAVEDDPEAVRHVGMYHATRQCHELIENGVTGIHFYTLNRSTATRAIFQEIKLARGQPVRSDR